MSKPDALLPASPCLCTALRRASRAVSRVYDDELRSVNLRGTQYALLVALDRAGEVRQGELSATTCLEDTSLTRNLRPLAAAGWIAFRTGTDRREKFVSLTEAGKAKLAEARPAWVKSQDRMKEALPEEVWKSLLTTLPRVTLAVVAG